MILAISGIAAGAHAVDGVIEINQVRAQAGGITSGDAPGFPVTLSEQGSYILTGNLEVADPNTNGIEITATGVHIDLNLFRITGPVVCTGSGSSISCSGSGTGVGILSSIQAVVLRDGSVAGFGGGGVSLSASASRLTAIYASRNGGSGITTSGGSTVVDCAASLNKGAGISVGEGGLVSASQARYNLTSGIVAGDGSSIRENVSRGNGGYGLSASSSLVGYAANVFSANNAGDANAQVSNGTDLGGNLCGPRTSCP